MMEVHIYKTPDEVIKAVAEFFTDKVNDAITKNGRCTVSLSGGTSPRKLYEMLATPSYKNKIDWARLYFFFGDERYVPFDDPDNNGAMVKATLFDKLDIPGNNIYYIDTTLSPGQSAEKYERQIYSHFGDNPIVFDLVLLGLGDNAHTASLFPHTPVLKENKKLVSAVYVEELQAYRITMTAALINEAHTIAFLLFGAAKKDAVYQVLEGEKNIEQYPAQIIGPENGTLHCFLDEAAASRLQTQS